MAEEGGGFSIVAEVLDSLIHAVLGGEENIIEKLVFEKVEELGKEKVGEILDKKFGGREIGERVEQAIKTRGASEFNRARSKWLNSVRQQFKIKVQGGQARLEKVIEKIISDEMQNRDPQPSGDWKKSRMDWLNEDWRHDWRSQPRNLAGRWLPGRLSYIFISHKAKKIRSARRRAIRKTVREMMRSGDG